MFSPAFCKHPGFQEGIEKFTVEKFVAYRENDRFYDKHPSIEGTAIRASNLIENLLRGGFRRICTVSGSDSYFGFCTFVRFHPGFANYAGNDKFINSAHAGLELRR